MADVSYTITGSEDAVQAARIAAGCHTRGWIVTLYPGGWTEIKHPSGASVWSVEGPTPGEAYANALLKSWKSGDLHAGRCHESGEEMTEEEG